MNRPLDKPVAPLSSPQENEVTDCSKQDRLSEALDEFYSAVDAGRKPDRDLLLKKYADVADELFDCLHNLDFIQNVAPQLVQSLSDQPNDNGSRTSPQASLGDFRIIREIGRGGMGVVYEAEQLSLGRRMALKVLPFAAMLDKQQLTRFKNEARAAATLDHPNIVAVHSVGEERGVHYYAMQLVEGQSLAQVIANLQKAYGISFDERERKDARTITFDTRRGRSPQPPTEEPKGDPDDTREEPPMAPSAETIRELQAAVSTIPAFDTQEYFRSVATLGMQAARGLDHAHQHGIVHRDVKPGNLLLNNDGVLYVTDFGLARMEDDAGMTMTGDLLGTLAYMSPEQALAKRVVVDHRTDIYSLGVTLYELLTLRPAYTGGDRQELLRKIAFTDPQPPRKLNVHIPTDLETIVCKAIEKNPSDRYATAQELGDDLNRFLENEPIEARRASVATRTTKWAQRHQGLMCAIAVLFTVVMIGLVTGLILLGQEQAKTKDALELASKNLRNARAEKAAAKRQRERAARNFRRAREAVDQHFTVVSESTLLDVPELAPLRKTLLEAALEYYEQFAKERSDDPEVKCELAAAHLRIAAVYMQLDEDGWLEELQHGLAILESLIADGVNITGMPSLRAGILRFRGSEVSPDRFADMRQVSDRAARIWEILVKQNPKETGLQRDLATWYAISGAYDKVTVEAANHEVARCRRAMAIWDELLGKNPLDADSAQHMGYCYPNLIYALANAGRHPEMADVHRLFLKHNLGAAVDYKIQIVTPGVYRLFLRWDGFDGGSDSLFVMIPELQDDFGGVVADWYAYGQPHDDGNFATFPWDGAACFEGPTYGDIREYTIWSIPDPGIYTIRVVMREGGAAIDAMIFQLARLPLPAKDGPAESAITPDSIFLESEGQVVIEAEDFSSRTSHCGSRWLIIPEEDPGIAVFKNPHHAFLQATPDVSFCPLGSPLTQQQQLDGVVDRLTRAIHDNPNEANHWHSRSSAYWRLGQWRNAISDETKAVELAPKVAFFRNELVTLLTSCPDRRYQDGSKAVEIAKELVQMAAEIDSIPKGDVWHALGIANYRVGEWKQAIEALDRCCEITGDKCYGFSGFYRAMAHWQLGNKEEAYNFYDKALKRMNPKHQVYRQLQSEAANLLGISEEEAKKNEKPAEAEAKTE